MIPFLQIRKQSHKRLNNMPPVTLPVSDRAVVLTLECVLLTILQMHFLKRKTWAREVSVPSSEKNGFLGLLGSACFARISCSIDCPVWKPTFIVGPYSYPGAASGKELTCQCRRRKRRRFRSLSQEDPLEEGMATHSSILAWRIPWTEEPGGYSPLGCKGLDTTEAA